MLQKYKFKIKITLIWLIRYSFYFFKFKKKSKIGILAQWYFSLSMKGQESPTGTGPNCH